MLKIFADECINKDIILVLRQNDFDVKTVKDAKLIGASDDEIFNFIKKSKRILVTFDRGFGDIFRFDISKSSGVIVVLNAKMKKDEVANTILGFTKFIANKNLKGKLVIVGKNKVRIIGR
ncbi:MAG: DUF5615 family PIN-like protein [Patescibacteria group bacterium]